jgi:hypothetical protein
MADDEIRYDILTQDALRGVVRKVLSEVARTGLPGEHHFFVTFATHAPGVRISSRLLGRYPEDMTIVLQHQYWDLTVTEHAFEVGLSFNGIPERLLVPFTAVKAFLDPSVQFGVQFEIAAQPGGAPAEAPRAIDDDAETVLDAEDETGVEAEPAPVAVLPATQRVSDDAGDAATSDDGGEDEEQPPSGAAQVVSLDAFRKKS